MKTQSYAINKGVNRSIEFRGLKAQYIWWLGGGILGLLAVFVVLYVSGLSPWFCVIVAGIGGLILFREVYRMSRRYGQYGLMKKQAARRVPETIKVVTRKCFSYGKRAK